MRRLIPALLVLLAAPIPHSLCAQKPLGINLAGVADYSTELAFTDAARQCREWIPFRADGSGPWSSGVSVPLDARGFPLEIPYDNGIDPPQKLRTLLLWDIGPALPVGQYRLIVEGQGRVSLRFGASGSFDCPVDTLVAVSGGVALELDASDAADPISRIRFIYPQYVQTFDGKPFSDELLDFLKDFEVIRFMDWMRTNGSPVVSWEERTLPGSYTQALPSGVAWEFVADLCNRSGKDAWITVPHRADDDYILQLAHLLQDSLDPERRVWLEFSNEVWNGGFSQHHDCAAFAAALGYTGQPWERAWKYTARRSAELFDLFEQVFEDDSRLTRVIPSQAASTWVTGQLMAHWKDPLYNPKGKQADVLAIAPYFGGSVADALVAEGIAATVTVPEILQRMELSLPEAFGWMAEQQAIAAANGLAMVTYEGGQHLVGTGNNVNNDVLTQKLTDANRHPGMKDLYCAYFDHWYAEHGGLFAHFSSHGTYSRWGSWGVKETMADNDNPKYLALKECVFEGDPSQVEGAIPGPMPAVYPNPSADGEFLLTGLPLGVVPMVTDLLGRYAIFRWIPEGDAIRLHVEGKGLHFLHFRGAAGLRCLTLLLP